MLYVSLFRIPITQTQITARVHVGSQKRSVRSVGPVSIRTNVDDSVATARINGRSSADPPGFIGLWGDRGGVGYGANDRYNLFKLLRPNTVLRDNIRSEEVRQWRGSAMSPRCLSTNINLLSEETPPLLQGRLFLVHDVAASKIACARPPLKWSSRSSIPQRASAFRRGAGGPGIGGQTHMIRLIITPFALVGFG